MDKPTAEEIARVQAWQREQAQRQTEERRQKAEARKKQQIKDIKKAVTGRTITGIELHIDNSISSLLDCSGVTITLDNGETIEWSNNQYDCGSSLNVAGHYLS